MHRAALSYASSPLPRLTDDQVVRTWAHLIDRCARRISARTANTVQAGDLWSVGALGLLDAYHRFDAGREVKFESFAEHRIRGAMIDELREMDHLPRRLRADADKLKKARVALGNTLGREPTNLELAQHLGMEVEDVDTLEAVAQPASQLNPDISIPSLDSLQDERIDHADRVRRMTNAIGTLNVRLQTVLSLHYVEGFTYKEIAGAMQISEARVCQLHGEAVKKLRALLNDEPVGEAEAA
ncbi:MAG: sigma-70 family RNA polymerase sigma factor [Archangium sp.]|nr:sigma-70 family RNA polymerase sigma factor [Archangium sp.]